MKNLYRTLLILSIIFLYGYNDVQNDIKYKQLQLKIVNDSINVIHLKSQFVLYRTHVLDSLSKDMIKRISEEQKLTEVLRKANAQIKWQNAVIQQQRMVIYQMIKASN